MSSIIETGSPRCGSGSLGAFFLLTFSGTWLLQLPAVLAQRRILPGDPASYLPLAMLGVLGPLAAATILTTRAEGRAGLGRLYGRLLQAKVSWLWYVVALLVPGELLTGALYLLNLAGREGPVHFHRGAATLVVGLIIAIAEEVGWRGYALPRMQEKLGPLAAAGLLGVLWTVWHVPMFLGLGIPLSLLLVMLLFFVGGSLTFSWIYNRTGQSLLLVVLAHLGAHLNNSHAALRGEVLPLVVHAIVYAAIGLAAATFDRRAFPLPTRERPAVLRRLT